MWPRLRGRSALAPQATCFDPTMPRTDLEGTLHSCDCWFCLVSVYPHAYPIVHAKNIYRAPTMGQTLFYVLGKEQRSGQSPCPREAYILMWQQTN